MEDGFYINYSENHEKTTLLHVHAFNELFYIESGEVEYLINDKKFLVEEGTFVFIPTGVPHGTNFSGGNEKRYVLNFNDDLFGIDKSMMNERFGNFVIHIPTKKKAIFEIILEKIKIEIDSGLYAEKLMQYNLISELLIRLMRLEKTEYKEAVNKTPEYISKIKQYISDNYDKPISLNYLSVSAFMNKTLLSRNFKKYVGITITEFINNVRIEKAEVMLIKTNESIHNIAFDCGFNNSSYFIKIFKKIKGTTPMNFRSIHKKEIGE